jgi:hypothetical protein
VNARTQERLDELARDAGRELALLPDTDRRDAFSHFVQIVAKENAAALAHYAKRTAEAA